MRYIIKNFGGGISDVEDYGIRGAFNFGKNLNIRKRKDTLSCNQALTNETAPVTGFDALIDWFVPSSDGNLYGFCRNGDILKRTSNGTWTLEYTDANGAILGAWEWGISNGKNYMFWATATRLNAKEIPGNATWSVDVNATITVGAINYTYPKTDLTSSTNHMMLGMGGGIGGLVINNDGKLALVGYDGSYTNEILTFTPGQKAKTLLQRGNNAVVGTISKNQLYKSSLFTWDGHDTEEVFGWDDVKPLPIKDIVGMIDTEVPLMVDNKGQVFYSDFGYDTNGMPVFTFPDNGVVSPGGVTNDDYVALFGVWGNGDKSGIYSYGRRWKNASLVPNLEYAIEADEIGAIIKLGDDLIVSYELDSAYYVSHIDTSNKAVGVWESLDLPKPIKYPFQKTPTWKAVIVQLEEGLPSGASISCKYKMNRESDWKVANTRDGNTTFATAGGKEAVFLVGDYGESARLQLTLTPSGNNDPEVRQIEWEFD